MDKTDKNDIALIHTEGLDEEIRCTMCTNSIKSDRGCDGGCVVNNAMYKEVMDVIENHIVDTDKMVESTTKNDLGVDCISRADARSLICEIDIKHHISGISRKAFKDLYNGMDGLPSVTPQEPRKGEWVRMSDLSEQEDDRYKCSHCGNVVHHKNKMDLYTFNNWCGRCGSDNGIHINYEVEE